MLHFAQLIVILVSLVTLINRVAKIFLLAFSHIPKNKVHPKKITGDSNYAPRVEIQVAISNENPQVVRKTLSALLNLDYYNYSVVVIDNNTFDKNLWLPIKKYCEDNSNLFKFLHIERLKGFKAGALKYALGHTPDVVELIAIVDSDNMVSPTFLKDLVGYFSDPKIAFVQTPLGFETDPSKLPFQSWIYLIYRYFLSIYMPATNQFGCAPFIGSMGIIRRSALEEAGGWDGFYLTEDMELSFRIFEKGYKSIFIDYSYGFSLPPYNFTNFKRQHFRWNFGNIQIWRDYVFRIFRTRQWNAPSLVRKLTYFSCPGIYANFYYLPFVTITCLVLALNSLGFYYKTGEQISFIILFVLVSEVIGEFFFFFLLGHKEKINTASFLKNFVSWWGLSVNNSLSTYATLLKPTHTFEITSKTSEKENANAAKFYERKFELVILLGIFFTLTTFLLLSPKVHGGTLLNAVILSLFVACSFLLPKK